MPRSVKSIAYMATTRPSQITSTILFPGLGSAIRLTVSPAGIVTATRFPFTSLIASVLSILNLLVCMAHSPVQQIIHSADSFEIASSTETFHLAREHLSGPRPIAEPTRGVGITRLDLAARITRPRYRSGVPSPPAFLSQGVKRRRRPSSSQPLPRGRGSEWALAFAAG